MQNLPVNEAIPGLKRALSARSRAVLQAPPGAGKTTLVPLALLNEAWLESKTIVLLEPRRLAARNAAARMAQLLGETVGETVGYQIRMESRQSKKTRILVVTEGILTRKLQSDPSLEHVGLIIFDEFHERSLHADLSLALALQSQELLRDDLKLLVMSATLHTTAVSGLLENAPVIESEGRSYPVTIRHLDMKEPEPDRRTLVPHMSRLIEQVIDSESGSILVFLPGVREISTLEKSLNEMLKSKKEPILVAPLYGTMSREKQDEAITAVQGRRKIVLATNIAETSLTIEGITVVVDSGLERTLRYTPSSGMNRLVTGFISKDSATQRSGRAGRLSAGACYRLWHETKILQPHQTPEILQADLTPTVLEIAAWGAEANELRWMDAPPAAALAQATELLKELGALSTEGVITDHGRAMLALGLHPRLAHMILKADTLGHGYEACLLAALLEERDILTGEARFSTDINLRLGILFDGEWGRGDTHRCRTVMASAGHFLQKLPAASKPRRLAAELTGVLLAFAYPDRIAKIRGPKEKRYLLSNGKGAVLDNADEQSGQPFLVVANLEGSGVDARIYLAASVTQAQLEEFFGDLIRTETTLSWNSEGKRVEAREKTVLGSLVLAEKPEAKASREATAGALLAGIREEGLASLPWSPASRSLQERVNFVNAQKTAHPALLGALELPDLSDMTLLRTMESWLLPYIDGFSGLKACQGLDLHAILLALIPWEAQQRLDALAPRQFAVPSGSKISVDYADPEAPVLAVRLQELFGQRETPSVLQGACPLLVHLLSPAQRPIQVTRDLKSFWQNGYTDVKKELKGRYPKHYWPDDPLTAQATGRTKKFM